MAILTINKMQEIKPASYNNVALLGQLIEEVEFYKIQKLLGTPIYNQIIEEVDSGNISDELKEILNSGLYKCISYFVYARYVQESYIQDTFTGMVQKNREDSSTISQGAMKNLANEYTEMAMLAFELVKSKIMKKYGTPEETVESGYSEIIGLRRGPECRRLKYTSNYFN